jgi:hypothetical protein
VLAPIRGPLVAERVIGAGMVRSQWRPGLVVGLLAVAAAAWAAFAATTAFPYLGIDHDEAVYMLQADTLRAGRLFPPAPGDPDVARSMLPWLSAQHGDVYVPKYSPAWPAVMAASRLVTGSYHTAQALVAAGVVVVTYLLAKEIVRSRATAVLAAMFVALSPFFLLQAPTFLSYLPNLLLLELFALCFIRAVRAENRGLLVVSGLVLGVAFFTRPFDALVFALPFGGWLVATRRPAWRRVARDGGLLALGAAGPLVATLLYFRAATGSAFRSPFLLDEHDTLGFGSRRILPGDPFTSYGTGEAWHGFVGHWALLSFWCFGGLVLIALAVLALRHRTTSVEPWFAALALAIPAAYGLFWGSYHMVNWEGPWRIGPFYYLPVLVPLAVLGAKGFVRFWSWDRALAAVTLVGMVAVSTFVAVRALGYQLERTAALDGVDAALDTSRLSEALVFLPSHPPHRLLTPLTQGRNASFDQKVLWALDGGSEDNRRVLDAFPGRRPYRLEDGATAELRPLTRVQGTRVPLRVVTNSDGAQDRALEVLWAHRRYRWPIAAGARIDIALTAAGVEGGPPATERAGAPGARTGDLVVRLLEDDREQASMTVPVERSANALDVVLPSAHAARPQALDVIAVGGR